MRDLDEREVRFDDDGVCKEGSVVVERCRVEDRRFGWVLSVGRTKSRILDIFEGVVWPCFGEFIVVILL